MIIECIRGEPNESDLRAMGWRRQNNWALWLTPGKRYVGLGISVFLEDQTVWVDVSEDGEGITSALLSMFQVVDPRPSQLWSARLRDNGFDLWPKGFYAPFFHERLGEQEPEVVEVFGRVFADLVRESQVPSPREPAI